MESESIDRRTENVNSIRVISTLIIYHRISPICVANDIDTRYCNTYPSTYQTRAYFLSRCFDSLRRINEMPRVKSSIPYTYIRRNIRKNRSLFIVISTPIIPSSIDSTECFSQRNATQPRFDTRLPIEFKTLRGARNEELQG